MKPIFLLGMPSSGKSTLGRGLSRALNYPFVDLDKRIELREGLTIPELFSLKGEDFFRKAESAALKSLPLNEPMVVSTGGGVPCFFDNMDFIKANGLSLFLDVPPFVLVERMLNTRRDDRPLYKKDNAEELLETLISTYEKRLPFYSQAHITVTGEATVEQLLETLRLFEV